MLVFQLTGYPRSGKDTLVSIVKDLLPNVEICNIAYADELKRMHMEELGINNIRAYNLMLHNNILYRNTINIRNDIGRYSRDIKAKNPNYFLNHVIDAISRLRDVDVLFITDLRYEHEYKYAKNRQHTIIKINRKDISEEDRLQPWNIYIEKMVPDITIDNTGTLSQYKDTIAKVVLPKLNFR